MKKKRIVIFFLLFALIGSLFVPLTAGAVDLGAVSQAVRQKDVDANAALLVNMTEDTIYYEKNAQQKVYPASITKVMTALLVLEAVEIDRDLDGHSGRRLYPEHPDRREHDSAGPALLPAPALGQ